MTHIPFAEPRRGESVPGSPARRRRGAPMGFTLIEMAIVLFIMALMFTIAIPYLGGYRSAELKNTARLLAGRATYLFDEAETHKLVLRMVFNLDQQVCTVVSLDPYSPQPVFAPATAPGSSPIRMPNTVRIRDVTVGDLGTFRAGVVAAQFYPEGYVDPTLIHLVNLSGQVMTLAFSPLTGQVLIAAGDRTMAQMMAQ